MCGLKRCYKYHSIFSIACDAVKHSYKEECCEKPPTTTASAVKKLVTSEIDHMAPLFDVPELSENHVRFATFNYGLSYGFNKAAVLSKYNTGTDSRFLEAASRVQLSHPHVLSMQEMPGINTDGTNYCQLFNDNYLNKGSNSISYPYIKSYYTNSGTTLEEWNTKFNLSYPNVASVKGQGYTFGAPADKFANTTRAAFGGYTGSGGVCLFSKYPIGEEHEFQSIPWNAPLISLKREPFHCLVNLL